MIVAKVTTPVAMRTATGRKSPRHFTLETETRCIERNEIRNSLKMPKRKRPMFKILGLHPGFGTRFLAAACIALAFILAAPASHASWSHRYSSGSSHHAYNDAGSSSSGTPHRSHHKKSY
jgi:hypothetical protein